MQAQWKEQVAIAARADSQGHQAKVWQFHLHALAFDLLISARPKQWIKNLFVFAALIFAAKLGQPGLIARACAAFLVFTALSSAIYLVNDVADREADRQHPRKAHRPIAAGRVSPHVALGAAIAMVILALGAGFLLDLQFGLLAGAYVVLMWFYTSLLKHLVLIDVFAIACGFVLRAAAGAAVIQVTISPWLYLCTILLSLFLGFGKRRHELLLLDRSANSHRRNLEEYTAPLLDDLITIVAAATVVAYSLYTFFADAVPHDHAMMVTIPFVLYGIFRYLLLIHRADLAGAPEEAVWKDRPLQVNLVMWAALSAGILGVFR